MIDWRHRTLTVLLLFAFGLLAQLVAAFGFAALCIYRLCKRQPLTVFHLMGLSLAIVSWISIGFCVSLWVTPYPRIFFDVQPGFIAIQALAIIMSALILLWILFMLAYRIKNDRCRSSGSFIRIPDSVNDGIGQPKTRAFHLFPPNFKHLSKFFLALWFVMITFHIIGIPGYFALNLLSFTIW